MMLTAYVECHIMTRHDSVTQSPLSLVIPRLSHEMWPWVEFREAERH